MKHKPKLIFIFFILFSILLILFYFYFYRDEFLFVSVQNHTLRTQDLREAQKRKSTPLIFAHRGDHFFTKPNSIASAMRAYEKKHDGAELDVRISKDGIPFVNHDDLIETKNGKLSIENSSSSDLKSTASDILTLDALLQKFQNKLYFILEIKSNNNIKFSSSVCLIADKYNMRKSVIISSLDPQIIQILSEKCPDHYYMLEIDRDYSDEEIAEIFKNYRSPFISMNIKLLRFREYPEIKTIPLLSLFTPNYDLELNLALEHHPFLIQTDRPGRLRAKLAADQK